MSKTIKDRLKKDDKVLLTRCYKDKDKYFATGEYASADLPDSAYELGLVIAKPNSKTTETVPAKTEASTQQKTKK